MGATLPFPICAVRPGVQKPVLLMVLVVLGSCMPAVTAPSASQAVEETCAAPGRLELVESRTIEADSLEVLHSLVLCDASNRRVDAYLRAPRRGERAMPVVVLLAGRYAGRDAALMIPPPLRARVLSVEYPATIPERLQLARMVRELPRVRDEALHVPELLVAAGHFAASQAGADPDRVALVGVSFGVPFAAIAGRDPIFSAVVLGFGGAGIAEMLAANMGNTPALVRPVLARFAGWYFQDLEPARYTAALGDTPLLLVNGVYDRQIPHSAALRLGAAAPPSAEHLWFTTGHIGAGQDEIIRAFAEHTMAFLDQVWQAPILARGQSEARSISKDE